MSSAHQGVRGALTALCLILCISSGSSQPGYPQAYGPPQGQNVYPPPTQHSQGPPRQPQYQQQQPSYQPQQRAPPPNQQQYQQQPQQQYQQQPQQQYQQQPQQQYQQQPQQQYQQQPQQQYQQQPQQQYQQQPQQQYQQQPQQQYTHYQQQPQGYQQPSQRYQAQPQLGLGYPAQTWGSSYYAPQQQPYYQTSQQQQPLYQQYGQYPQPPYSPAPWSPVPGSPSQWSPMPSSPSQLSPMPSSPSQWSPVPASPSPAPSPTAASSGNDLVPPCQYLSSQRPKGRPNTCPFQLSLYYGEGQPKRVEPGRPVEITLEQWTNSPYYFIGFTDYIVYAIPSSPPGEGAPVPYKPVGRFEVSREYTQFAPGATGFKCNIASQDFDAIGNMEEYANTVFKKRYPTGQSPFRPMQKQRSLFLWFPTEEVKTLQKVVFVAKFKYDNNWCESTSAPIPVFIPPSPQEVQRQQKQKQQEVMQRNLQQVTQLRQQVRRAEMQAETAEAQAGQQPQGKK